MVKYKDFCKEFITNQKKFIDSTKDKVDVIVSDIEKMADKEIQNEISECNRFVVSVIIAPNDFKDRMILERALKIILNKYKNAGWKNSNIKKLTFDRWFLYLVGNKKQSLFCEE